LSTEDPTRLLSILRTIKQIGYDPRKIVARFSQLESLRQTERGLIDNCRVLEERVSRCREVLPLCEQIVQLRIGIGELLAFHTAVCERAEKNNLSRDSAAYLVIEDIRDYDKLGGMKKQQSDVAMQIYALNQFSGRQNNAITALFKLQSLGITDDQVLSMCRFFEEYSRGMASGFKRAQDMNYIQGK